MKVSIKAFCLICIFLCGLFSQNSSAQSRSAAIMQSAYAAQDAEDFQRAAMLFEKAYFFGNAQEKNAALEAKALSLKDLGRFGDALDALRRVNLSKLDNDGRFSIRYQMILCAFLAKEYAAAKSNILIAEQAHQKPQELKDLLFMKILVANAMMEWDLGKEYTAELAQLSNWENVQVNELYGKKYPKIKDPHKAALWSTFLPGSGQVYAGSPGKGFLSAGTQAICLTYGVYHLLNKFYFTAFLSGFALFQAFYFGGADQAAALTEKNNLIRVDAYNQGISRALIDLRKGDF